MEDRYRIDMLWGCCLLTVGRAADLVWWQFEKDGIPYALHTQCAFRVTHEGVLLVTRSSIYDVFEDNDDPHNNRVFDKNVVKLNQLLPAKVLQVECSPMNDLRIMTGNQLCIEIFADNDAEYEQWRFFRRHVDVPHLVAYTGHSDYE